MSPEARLRLPPRELRRTALKAEIAAQAVRQLSAVKVDRIPDDAKSLITAVRWIAVYASLCHLHGSYGQLHTGIAYRPRRDSDKWCPARVAHQ